MRWEVCNEYVGRVLVGGDDDGIEVVGDELLGEWRDVEEEPSKKRKRRNAVGTTIAFSQVVLLKAENYSRIIVGIMMDRNRR